MKKYILLIFLLLSIPISSVFAQTWQWAKSAGSNDNDDVISSICKDSSGNIYAIGNIQNPIAYFGTDSFIVNGYNDIFLAKYDSAGTLVWLKHFGGFNFDRPGLTEYGKNVIYNHNTNSIYISGDFVDSFHIDSCRLHGIIQKDQGRQIFLAKLDLNGHCIWAKSMGSSGHDGAGSMVISSSNKIYLSGTVQYDALFDTFHVACGNFLAMYNDSGKCQWVKNIISGRLDNSMSQSVRAAGDLVSIYLYQGDIFMTGNKISDSMYLDTILFAKPNNYSNILARLDSMGHVKWAREMGPSHSGYAGLSMDDAGNSYIVSYFNNGYAHFGTDSIFSSIYGDFFLVKYDLNGNFKWVRQSQASLGALSYYCKTDGNGNVYICGDFSGNANFDSTTITSTSTDDLFIARYDSMGTFIGGLHAGQATGGPHSGQASAREILPFINNTWIVGGVFVDTLKLGTTTLLSHGGHHDIFIAKVDMNTGTGMMFSPMKKTAGIGNNQLLIYANPTTGKCTIKVPDDFLNERNLVLNIYDNSGKEIQQQILSFNDGKVKLNLEEEAKGTYNVTLSSKTKTYYGKIIFQ